MFIKDGIAYAGEPVSGVKVIDVKVVNDLSMLATFSTGETRLFDAAYLTKLPAFEPLANRSVFDAFKIDRGVVTWNDGDIDVAPQEMYVKSFKYETVA